MKKLEFKSVSLAVGLSSMVVLSACTGAAPLAGGVASTEARVQSPAQTFPIPLISPAPSASPSPTIEAAALGVNSFAQNLSGVSLSYDQTSQIAYLGFDLRTGELDSVSVPIYLDVTRLSGKATKGVWAELKSDEYPEFSAKLLCADDACAYSQIEISSVAEKIPGSAKVNYTSLVNADVALNLANEPVSGEHVMGAFSNALQGIKHFFVDLEISDIAGGKTSFVMRFNLEHSEGSISGDVGQDVPIYLGYYTQEGRNMTGGAAPYLADVSFDPSRSFIGVKFKEKEGEGMTSVGAGAQLFPGNVLQ